MRKKQLLGMVLILGLLSGLFPTIVFGITSYSTGASSPTIDPFTDDNWYESNDEDSEVPPSHNPATSTNRTDTQYTYSSSSKYRYEIPSTIREGGPLYTKIWVQYDDSPKETTLISFLDASNNTLFSEVPTNTSKGSYWYELDFTDWSGYAIKIQIDLAAQDTIQTAGSNTYDDEVWGGSSWSDDPRDGLLIIYYVANYGYQESMREIDEWDISAESGTTGNAATDGDELHLYFTADDAGDEYFNYRVHTNIDSSTYQFFEIKYKTDTQTAVYFYWDAGGWQYIGAYSTDDAWQITRINLEEKLSGATATQFLIKVTDAPDSTSSGQCDAWVDYVQIKRFYEWTDAESDGNHVNYAYESSGDLITSIDTGKYLNLTDDISDFSTDNYPYCRLETSAGTVGVTLIDSGDAELETKNFTASTDTQQFSFGLAVDEIRLQIYDDMTIDFITFSVMNVTISGITANLEDTYASPDQTITISSVTGSWGDGQSISSSNLWVDLKENSTYVQTNETSPSRTVQLYNSTYEVGIGHTNDSRYRYFTSGTNYTFWMIGTEITGNFYYDVQRIADVNYIITFYQTSQLSWLNGSIISTTPDVYSYLNTTENGYRVLGDDAWLPDGVYPVSVTNAEGQYETTFAFNLTTGDFWEEFYSTDIIPIDKVESHLIFSFYSSYDGFGLPNELLKIYVDDTRVYHNEHWTAGNTINLTITDYFNNAVEWSVSGMGYPDYEFTAADIVFIDVELPFYPLQFFNPGDHDLIVELNCSSITKNITVPPKGFSAPYRVIATTFTYRLYYMEENQGETTVYEWRADQDYSVTVSSESYNFELPGLYDPEPTPPSGGDGLQFWHVLLFGGIALVGSVIVGGVVRSVRRKEDQAPIVPPEPYEKYRNYKTQEDAYVASQRDARKQRQKAIDDFKKRTKRRK